MHSLGVVTWSLSLGRLKKRGPLKKPCTTQGPILQNPSKRVRDLVKGPWEIPSDTRKPLNPDALSFGFAV